MSRQQAFPEAGDYHVFVQETSPGVTTPDSLWLKPSTKEIYFWNAGSQVWTLFGTLN